MKKALIIVFVVLLLGAGGYTYFNFFQSPSLTSWSFIPAEAVAVYESDNPLAQWKNSREKKIWKNLITLPAFAKLDNSLGYLDSIAGKNGSLDSFFENSNVLISMHTTSKSSIDFLLAVQINKLEQHSLLSTLVDHFSKSNDITSTTRQYLGHTITELTYDGGSFAYIFLKNHFVGSFTPFLVEDAIRVIEDAEIPSFSEQHQRIFDITRLEQDQGNIFLNTKSLDQIASVFTDPLKGDISILSSLSDISFLDIAINDDNVLLTGFSLNHPVKENYLSSFDGVVSSEFEMSEVIPNNTASLVHFSFDNMEKWHSGLKEYWRKSNPSFLTKMGELENKYNVNISDIYNFIDTEIGLIVVESVNPEKPDLALCMKLSNHQEAQEFFKTLSDDSMPEGEAYSESWSEIPLGYIEIDELPSRLFGPVFSGFSSSFYCQLGDFFLVGNNEQVIKELIDEFNVEDTWRKSIKVNNFLDIANREANLSLFFNTPGAWNIINNHLNDDWKRFFNEYDNTIKQIEFGAFQFSNVDGKYYTNVALQHPGRIIERVEAADVDVAEEIEFSHKLISKPYAVRNHNDRSLEMLVQDSLNQIYLISSKYDTLWSKPLDGEISGPVYQVDYYKNGKLQYLIKSDKSVYIIDRNGEDVAGYPFGLENEADISLLSLIDYDNSKKYRIMTATDEGDYFLFDKAGKNLEGWQPKSLEGKPVVHPFHLRVRSRDYMVFMHRNGLVYVLNRRGEPVKGFPLDVKGIVENPLFIQKGGTLDDTRFTTLTNEGELVQFNLEGKFINRNQLYKSTSRDQFKMIISSNKRSFMILRSDDEKVVAINSKGEELFYHNFETPELSGQYYNFSSDNEVIVLTDREKEYTYLYNREGKLLHSLPIQTGEQIAMLYIESQNTFKLYKTFSNKFSVINLER
ncbi:MAG: hypothetical protein JXQ96_03045 [Cyclobacteriaceae bacterium]